MGETTAVGASASGRYWVCPNCGRHAPARLETCRCGAKRPAPTAAAASPEPAPAPVYVPVPAYAPATAPAAGTLDDLVYPNERPLFTISLVLSVGFWLLLLVGTLGIALVYALLFFVVYLFAQSGLIAYIKGNAVRITPQQYPDLYQKLEACCQRLGMSEVPETYLLQAGGSLNAFATRFLGRNFLVLFSDVVDALADRPSALQFYLGHELAHVERGHLKWRPVLLPASFLPLLGPAYQRACESTCDNYGAACCDDVEDATRALVVLAAGARRWRDLDLGAYLQQASETSGFWMSFHELVSDYPWLVKRVARVLARGGAQVEVPPRNPLAYLFALFVPRSMAGAGAASVLMMVAVIGIIAAIAIPSLLRARVSANESAAIGDVRTVVSAEAAYASAARAYGPLECLAAPAQPGCIPGYPARAPRFLDAEHASGLTRNGYEHIFVAGEPATSSESPNGLDSYCYAAVPAQPGQTGIRSFAADHTGRLCFDPQGENLCASGSLPFGCQTLN